MEKLWMVMEKYDNQLGMKSFCDALSKVIQHTHGEEDIINIISATSSIDEKDADTIDSVINLKEVLF